MSNKCVMSKSTEETYRIAIIVEDSLGNQQILRSKSAERPIVDVSSMESRYEPKIHKFVWEPHAEANGSLYTVEDTEDTGPHRKVRVPGPLETSRCSFCNKVIVRSHEKWYHADTKESRCYPENPVATPKEGK